MSQAKTQMGRLLHLDRVRLRREIEADLIDLGHRLDTVGPGAEPERARALLRDRRELHAALAEIRDDVT